MAEALLHLHAARADDEFAVLLARDPAVHVAVDDLFAVRSLAVILSVAGAEEQAAILIDRAVAHARSDDPGSILLLVSGLEIAEAQEQEKRVLASDPASRVAISDPSAVGSLLFHLRRVDSQEQTAALLMRDPAANATLEDLSAVADLLRRLQKTGSGDQVSTLAGRAVNEAVLSDFWDVRTLLGTLREIGAENQAEMLVSRLPAAGLFHLFLEQKGNPMVYRFGREPGGIPAKPWGWEDLDLRSWPKTVTDGSAVKRRVVRHTVCADFTRRRHRQSIDAPLCIGASAIAPLPLAARSTALPDRQPSSAIGLLYG